MLCPICQLDLTKFSEIQRDEHGDKCLDKCQLLVPAIDEVSSLPPPKKQRIDEPNHELATLLEKEPEKEPEKLPAPPATKKMPFYKKIFLKESNKHIAVDAFCYGIIPDVTHYFLSHFHYDHYTKLNSKWTQGLIYCSYATARLVESQLKVPSQFIRPLDLNTDHLIDGIKVRLMEANHCPGAVIFLFNDKVLHTGDFRADEQLISELKQMHLRLDTLYLDTTYLDPGRLFPSQSKVINLCANQCLKQQQKPPVKSFFTKERKRNILVVVGTYTIGKEKIALEIAKLLNTRIFPNSTKRRILKLVDDPEFNEMLGNNDKECQVHLASMSEINLQNLEKKLDGYRSLFTHIIGIIPTGWSWGKNQVFDDTYFQQREVTSSTKSKRAVIYRVPYSEHSSYQELETFCREVPAKRIISTVSFKYTDLLRSWQTN